MLRQLQNRWKTRKRGNHEKIICLVGESGSGKSILAASAEHLGYRQLDSYTTRPPRSPDERHHTFVTPNEFNAIRGDLVAHTVFDRHEYGATRRQIRRAHMYAVDPYGVEVLSENLERENMVVLYLHTSPVERLRRMTEKRGRLAAEERIEHDFEKFSKFSDYDILLPSDFPFQFQNNKRILLALLRGWLCSKN